MSFKSDDQVLFSLESDVLIETSGIIASYSPLHYHDHFELELVIGGEGKQIFNGQEFPLKKGSFFLCRPIDNHQITGNDIKLRHIKAKDSFLPKWVLNKAYALNNPIVIELNEAEFTSLNELMILAEREQQENEEYASEIIKEICSIAYTIFFRKALIGEGKKQELINRICYFVQHNNRFKEKITLEEIAEYVGYSKSYTSTMFRKCCNRTIQDYIINVRIEYAKGLLLKTDYPITRIIEECGFSSSSSFYMKFVELVGTPPLQYKKNVKTNC